MSEASSQIAVLSAEQRQLLTAVLDQLVPANGTLPGAGALGVADNIEHQLAASPLLRRLFGEGLVAIELTSARLADRPFAALAAEHQEQVLRTIEREQPRFFAQLIGQTYRGYYTLPAVQAAIGHDGRAPQPRGQTLPAFDLTLLDRQRQRAPFWRRT